MRILILGGNGMVGHALRRWLSQEHETAVTLRDDQPASSEVGTVGRERCYYGVDVRSVDQVRAVLEDFTPAAVVNAAGLVKQRPEIGDPVANIEVNALFPHQLARLTRELGGRLLHVSTDCVFSGRRGDYTEADLPDPSDEYGRAKLLGEPDGPQVLTLRVSVIGLELQRRLGLIEWALAQDRPFAGYRQARFNGLTTKAFADLVELVLGLETPLGGTWHVSSAPISKYDLLVRFFDILGRPVEIKPDDRVVVDRTLRSEPFRAQAGWEPPSWDTMLFELAEEVRDRESQHAP
jgi:dTDP-4-dehydrorhamnose reductase